MADDREYDASAELDTEAKAFLEREDAGEHLPTRDRKAKPEADFDPTERDVSAAGEDDGDKGGAPAGDTDDAALESAKQRQDETERQARALGWAPKEEFKGHGGAKWVDAAEFLERSSPRQLRKLLDDLSEARESDKRDYDTRVTRIEKLSMAAIERQQKEFDRRIKDWEAEKIRQVADVASEHGKDAAVEHAGKWDAFIEQERKARPEVPAAEQAKPANGQGDMAPEAKTWLEKRPEFYSNKIFGATAYATMGLLEQEMPNAPMGARFAELDRRLAPRFPEVYSPQSGGDRRNGNGNGAPPADSRSGAIDGVRIAGKKSTNYASRLNATERRLGEKWVKRGDFPNLEAYAKEVHSND